ncbi:MAG: NTP transferase domain-containing protein, partial [Spirochaetia bacterium]|nr:NTP transferase domain-containing protein [Spirochaetia bacterium]
MTESGFILAAGFGKRMGEYTKTIPKPLLPVAGIPLIYYSLYNLFRWKISKIYINVHYLGGQIVNQLSRYPHAELIFSEEEKILGTAGGIRTALGSSLDQKLVLLNPDTIFLPDDQDAPDSIPEEVFNSVLFLSERDINSRETGMNLQSGKIEFSERGKYYYIGYSVMNAQILEEIPKNQEGELGHIWRKLHPPEGRIYRGSYFDCGNALQYEGLKEKN